MNELQKTATDIVNAALEAKKAFIDVQKLMLVCNSPEMLGLNTKISQLDVIIECGRELLEITNEFSERGSETRKS